MRGGRAGGYKELDEEELEETKRRRWEAEGDDGEMYDEFGNLKKKFHVKAQQTEAGQVLPGTGREGWEVEELGFQWLSYIFKIWSMVRSIQLYKICWHRGYHSRMLLGASCGDGSNEGYW
ncbi:hypothetical protein Hdeb2414_s0019g00545471 [Helianthus debilis subsp. tardiflorus]